MCRKLSVNFHIITEGAYNKNVFLKAFNKYCNILFGSVQNFLVRLLFGNEWVAAFSLFAAICFCCTWLHFQFNFEALYVTAKRDKGTCLFIYSIIKYCCVVLCVGKTSLKYMYVLLCMTLRYDIMVYDVHLYSMYG